ncbi:MAG: molecular chaperone HtpG [Deltaproteobacteria bacterium]|nr:molecular chaperone HtpG [Deltaproteobacteria bacterium]
MSKETRQFQTEVKQILDIMIHSLYSQREVFLRELISNASDALSKLRFEEIKDLSLASGEKSIRLVPDKNEHSLTIVDNGVGMSYDEVVSNIGTIAYSGSKDFLKKAQELKDHPELIGQFGVGFYSAFMVADRVQLHTQKAGSTEGVLWESTGDGGYSIEKTPRPEGTGTSVKVFLKKKDEKDESYEDFTDEWILRSVVKKYSDFIEFPIKMKVAKSEQERDSNGNIIVGKKKDALSEETLNSQKALWLRPSKDVKKEEYNEFYKHVASDWTEPLDVLHYKAEGVQEFTALVYMPSTLPFDYNQRNIKWGLSLYVKRVFITANCEQVLPSYLRFLKGVVDSSDLPLNVSRELIQKDRQIHVIRKALTSKLIRHFKEMLETKREVYDKMWEKFGPTLKEGLASDLEQKEELQQLALFHTNLSDKLTTLQEYVGRMKDGQKAIYYMTGESLSQLASSPFMEKLQKKDYEVLFLVDPVDEWVTNSLREFEKKPLQSISREDLDLGDEVEKAKKKEERQDQEKRFAKITNLIKDVLNDAIKDVKLSDRLVDSPVCLVSSSQDPSANMERLMEAMGQEVPKSKRILEINPSHPVFEKMLTLPEDRMKNWAEILYNQALLSEGSPIKDPAKFSRQIADLMTS